MANLDNIYNQNYGTSVVTNGNFVVIGNPPSKTYDRYEGISRVGQVFVIKKDTFNSNYQTVKVLYKKLSADTGTLPTYYTEQSSSNSFTSSFVVDNGPLNDTSVSCSYIVIEDDNNFIYQSNYGSSIDLSTHFLAVGDTGVSSSFYFGQTSSFASVDVYVIDPNYSSDVNGKISNITSNSPSYINNYDLNPVPICSITGSIGEKFGYSVNITENYLAVGAPMYNGGRGAVYIYKHTDANCVYKFESLITCDLSEYPEQYGFGHSICFDKYSEKKLLIGSNQLSHSNVFLYTSSSNGWQLSQVFSQNTSSIYYKLDNSTFEFFPSGSQINDRFGYSVGIFNNVLAIGAPNDLIYWEYSGSDTLRQRGSVYLYNNQECDDSSFSEYKLLTKLYGDNTTFKDNLFGYSLSIYNGKLLIGSPKPYFPFSSLFASSSIDYYDKTFNQNDFGESTYCGQSLLYHISQSTVKQMTSQPIAKRKELGKPFNAFGYSVSVSDTNFAIGAPIPLNDDFYLSGLLITESGSISSDPNFSGYLYTSSYQSEDCQISSNLIYFRMEECLSCDMSGAISGCGELAVFVDEQGEYYKAGERIFGKTYIYNLSDLEKDYTVGNIFYNNNRFVINNTGSILANLTRDPTDTNKPYLFMQYQSQISLFEKQYICTIETGEFNVSTNPTSLTSSPLDYGVVNTEVFDFNNLDIILRYINYNITANNSEKWWTNFVSGDVDESIFGFYTSSYENYQENRLTQELKNQCSTLNFDVNEDGIVNVQDGTSIWKYFIQDLTINNYQDYINPRSKRKNYNDIMSFLNEKTGKFNKKYIDQSFFEYNYSSSIDPTGSYLAPYITTVGLYSGADLVAIAKLAQPIKNTGEIPINIVVKWDT
jgi:hypothetical protein